MNEAAEKRDERGISADLGAIVAAAHAALSAHAARIDALNVYPVPDGDTGTNMLMTLRSVVEAVSGSSYPSQDEAARAVARAALMGARGNSGVILSQVLRGACDVLGEAETFGAGTVAAALLGAERRAYAAVAEPVEGTMLSVLRDAAGAARSRAEDAEAGALEVLRAAAREAHASVGRTPEQLAVLKEAGVVDAGGLGLAVILDSVVAALGGEELPQPILDEGEPAGAGRPLREMVAHSAEEIWGYCTEFVVDGFLGNEEEFGRHIREIGESVLVIPDAGLVKVHLHTQDPGGALTYASSFGRLSGVKIEDMEAQTRERAARGTGNRRKTRPEAATATLGAVAASRGTGNRALFEAMGVVVVEGGQGANPSAEELARAVVATGAEDVVLLPNNKNVLPTAERVGELVEGARVHVVPTASIAEGLAVMVGFDAEGEPEEVVEEMRGVREDLRGGEVTRAVRDARVNGREVREGDCLGLLDGELIVVEETVEAASLRLVRAMLEGGGHDVVTLLWGAEMTEAEAGRIADGVRGIDPDLVVEVKSGGQPLYPLQMVAE